MSVQEKETQDRIDILKYVFVTPEKENELIKQTTPGHVLPCYINFVLPIVPPARCSDNVRRNLRDYIDFLFPGPFIEDLIRTSNLNRTSYDVNLEVINSDIVQITVTVKEWLP
jgi:hypothetical protein